VLALEQTLSLSVAHLGAEGFHLSGNEPRGESSTGQTIVDFLPSHLLTTLGLVIVFHTVGAPQKVSRRYASSQKTWRAASQYPRGVALKTSLYLSFLKIGYT
jgi:hypothetical protein